MTYIQTNNPIQRKTSPLRVDPFAKKEDKATTISPGVISIKDPASENISVHEGGNPYKLTPGVDGMDKIIRMKKWLIWKDLTHLNQIMKMKIVNLARIHLKEDFNYAL